MLYIDIETYSDVDLKEAGVYNYVKSPAFEILLISYAYNDEPIKTVDLARGEKLTPSFLQDLQNPKIIKIAFNSTFEFTCLNKLCELDINQWQCSKILAAYARFNGSLEAVGKGLDLPEEKSKQRTGKSLIKYFCVPCEPTKSNCYRTRNYPEHDLEKWELFKEYNAFDVIAEREIHKRLEHIKVPEKEWELWRLDQKINARGVKVDAELIDKAINLSLARKEEKLKYLQELTNLSNPNSAVQLKDWLSKREGYEIESLAKGNIEELENNLSDTTSKEVLSLRKDLSKTSVAKYEAMNALKGEDDRIRGILQFYGAGTGRWAGRGVQVHNLPKNKLAYQELLENRDLIKHGTSKMVDFSTDQLNELLMQLIRTAFIAEQGKKLIVVDYSAIEARVIAWLANELWRLGIFSGTGKIYEASAANMFNVPIETIAPDKENYHLRQKGKVAELALGYQGGVGALKAMGALKMGLKEEELPELVELWRQSSPEIVKLWYGLERAAKDAIQGIPSTYRGIGFRMAYNKRFNGLCSLEVILPSKRSLHYPRAKMTQNSLGRSSIVYWGMEQNSKKWTWLDMYGGKFAENVVQAIARDCLAESIKSLEQEGFSVVMHVHDEVIIEAEQHQTLEQAKEIMSRPITWAKSLYLKGEGFEGEFYRKE